MPDDQDDWIWTRKCLTQPPGATSWTSNSRRGPFFGFSALLNVCVRGHLPAPYLFRRRTVTVRHVNGCQKYKFHVSRFVIHWQNMIFFITIRCRWNKKSTVLEHLAESGWKKQYLIDSINETMPIQKLIEIPISSKTSHINFLRFLDSLCVVWKRNHSRLCCISEILMQSRQHRRRLKGSC